MNIPNVSINDTRTVIDRPAKPSIQLDRGFFPVSIECVRKHWGISETEQRFWHVENRRTGVVEAVLGPCTFEEMVKTWAELEGGEMPVGQGRYR